MTRFFDFHVYPPVAEFFAGPFGPFIDGLRSFYGRDFAPVGVDDLAGSLRARGGKAVLMGWDAETATGRAPFSNRAVADLVARHPDVLVGFGAVDPNKGAAAIAGVHEARRLGLRGLAFHPPAQRFSPADRRVYPVWEVAEEERLPVLLHTGFSALGAGTRGGSGIELGRGDPMLVDEMATDFPELQVVVSHRGSAWLEEALAVLRHKENLHLELSGWLPRSLPPGLSAAISGPLAERALFASGYPFCAAEDLVAEWEQAGLPDELLAGILAGNALRLLGLEA